MANYQESSVSGTSYTRARIIQFENPKDGYPKVIVNEEKVTILTDRTIIESVSIPQYTYEYLINKEITDFTVTFPMINPLTNEPIEGLDMTYQDLYIALYSMYWHLAKERDEKMELINNPPPIEPPA